MMSNYKAGSYYTTNLGSSIEMLMCTY